METFKYVDSIPPGKVQNLKVTCVNLQEIKIDFEATGDDNQFGSGIYINKSLRIHCLYLLLF